MQIPAFVVYKMVRIASPFLFGGGPSSPADPPLSLEQRKEAQRQLSKDRLSKRQQKLYVRYEKGDKRVQRE